MNIDHFSKGPKDPFKSADKLNPSANKDIFVKPKAGGGGGLGRTRKPEAELEPLDIPIEPVAPEPEKPKPSVVLSNPKWEAEKVGFNEETDVSVELTLPPEQAHKTKVTFELFAKTPKGPQRISQGEAHAENGKATCRLPVFIPNYKDADGNSLQKVEYSFIAKHSDSEPLDTAKSPKLVDEMAERLIEIHILPGLHFATNQSFLHPKQADALKDMCAKIKAWREKTPDGKLAVFGHADAVGNEEPNKALSERRAKSVFGFLMKDAEAWSELDKEENWSLSCIQDLLKHLGHDPGASDGKDGPKTQAAVKDFQSKKGLPPDGKAGPGTRKALYQAFMDDCNNLTLKAKDFDDINGNPTAGCSEFNLVEKTQGACEANRRVAVLWLKSNKNFPIRYPCAKGDISACKAQVAKAGARRTAGFGCQFYDGLVVEKSSGGKKVTGEAPKAVFKTLSPWFIPGPSDEGGETADIEIELKGGADRADHFELEVYGSGYCDAERKDDGTFTFTALDQPVVLQTREFADAAAKPGVVKISDWNGEVSATEGALKEIEGKKSFINVAFSPYTALGRYYLAPNDKICTMVLGGFWPAFKDGKIQSESLKVTWKISGTSKLKKGKLEFVDKSGAVIFDKDLAAEDGSEGDHEFAWDGKNKEGAEATPDLLPIRPRISLWSEDTEAEAVALCAMQTEVRLFVHPDTDVKKDTNPYPQSLAFALPPQALKAPEEKDQDAWTQYQLAEAGFHPGPVGIAFGDHAKIALKEFQRSHPKESAAPFTRLKPTGNRDADTLSALKRLKPDTRPWFGDIASRAELSRKDAEALLGVPEKDLVIWVDDRHTNTSAGIGDFFMDDYHGEMDIGDTRPAKDQTAIPRPWIPLSASLSLLSKTATLADKEAKKTDAAARALGFLRMDFRHLDPEPDHSVVDTGHAQFKTNLHRSRKWMQETYQDWTVNHKGEKLSNAPETQGGIRPADPAGYFKKTFGIDADSLPPFLTVADDAVEKVSLRSLQNEVTDKIPKEMLGRFNVYFRPSIIAGDGFQVEAALGLDKEPAKLGNFPNQAGLALRYPVPPKGRTARFRIWRKASYRAYACWAPAAEKHWPAQAPLAAELYRGANLHMIHESGAPQEFKVTDLVTAKEYSDNIKATVTDPAYTSLSISLDPEKVWPYTKDKRLGIPISKLGGTLKTFYNDVFDPMFNSTWRVFRKDLLHLLMKQVEKLHGLHRGYFLTEFRSSQDVNGVEYACGKCKTTIVEVVNNLTAAETLAGKPCKKAGCKGTWSKSKASTWDGIPMPAVGVSMGGTWLFTSGDHTVWAHEIGHIRHLEHSPSQPGSAKIAPGGKAAQHDSQTNPDPALSAEPAKDQGWDRACVMSYNFKDPEYFCGKCLLKNRGLSVENLTNPAGAKHD